MTKCTHPKGHDLKLERIGDDEHSVYRYTCKRRGCTHSSYNGCTIMRIVEARVGLTINMISGEVDGSKARFEIRRRMCGVPMFGEHESARGICRSCANGWEAPGNRFASPEERARAMEGKP